MGLMNASQQFQQMKTERLKSVRYCADQLIDDILVITSVGDGENLSEAHEKDVCRVLEVLKQNEFVTEKAKSVLFKTNVEVFGHILEHGTRRPAPGKLGVI